RQCRASQHGLPDHRPHHSLQASDPGPPRIPSRLQKSILRQYRYDRSSSWLSKLCVANDSVDYRVRILLAVGNFAGNAIKISVRESLLKWGADESFLQLCHEPLTGRLTLLFGADG